MEEVDLKIQDILKILKSRWKIILGMVVAMTLIAAVMSFFIIKPMYESDTKVFIGKEDSSDEKYSNNDVLMYQNLLKTYSELVTSYDLIDVAINRNNLSVTPEEVISRLGVNPRIDTQILEISYQNNDNVLAKEVLESVVDEFIKDTKELIPNGTVKVIESAKIPEYPVKPNKTKNISLACLAGLMLGSVIAFLLEYMDDTLKTKEQIEKTMEIPVIGMIPCEGRDYIKKKKIKQVKKSVSA